MDAQFVPWIIAGITALLGGGGIAAVLKARPEAGQISVAAAQGAVVVQSSVIDDLRVQMNVQKQQLIDQANQISDLQRRVAKTYALEASLEDAHFETSRLRNERDQLKERVDVLEAEVKQLKKAVNGDGKLRNSKK